NQAQETTAEKTLAIVYFMLYQEGVFIFDLSFKANCPI
ncbi:MAG: hypothetical protein ACJAS5_001142, partial [Lentimonas sp.]